MQKKIQVNKLVLLGDVYVGKTSIATRFAKDEFSDLQESTVGAVFLPHSLEMQDYIIKFEIWDTAGKKYNLGQERFRSLGQMYYKGSRAAIVVFDLTLHETFKKAKQWVKELNENASADIVIALVGNKLDLEENRQVTNEEAVSYAENQGLIYFEASAKNNINIQKIFLEIAKKLPLIENKQNQKLQQPQNIKNNYCYCKNS